MRWLCCIVVVLGCGRVTADENQPDAATPDACTVVVPEMREPGRMPGACTLQQIADLDSCPWPCASPSGACYACVKPSVASTTEGPIVTISFDAYDIATFGNTSGCVDLASGTTGCGEALWQRFECVGYECDHGGIPEYPCAPDAAICEPAALAGPCKPYADAVTVRCKGLVGPNDTPAPMVAACFPDPTITDPNAQRIALWKSIATVFCGP